MLSFDYTLYVLYSSSKATIKVTYERFCTMAMGAVVLHWFNDADLPTVITFDYVLYSSSKKQ